LLPRITKLKFGGCSYQLFLDDSERNITAGKALGLRTALVRNVSLAILFCNKHLSPASIQTRKRMAPSCSAHYAAVTHPAFILPRHQVRSHVCSRGRRSTQVVGRSGGRPAGRCRSKSQRVLVTGSTEYQLLPTTTTTTTGPRHHPMVTAMAPVPGALSGSLLVSVGIFPRSAPCHRSRCRGDHLLGAIDRAWIVWRDRPCHR